MRGSITIDSISNFYRHPESDVLSEHPKIVKAKRLLRSKLSDKTTRQFIENNISFLYPNIACVSYDFDPKHNLFSHQYKFIAELTIEAFSKYDIDKIVVDLRNTSVSSCIILDLVDVYYNSEQVAFRGIVCSDSTQSYILQERGQKTSKSFYFSPEDAKYDYLRKYGECLPASELMISGAIDLSSLEMRLKKDSLMRAKHIDLIRCNFEGITDIDLISVNLLIIYLHTLAHKCGALFELSLPNSKKARHEFIHSRFVKLLEPLLIEPILRYKTYIDNREMTEGLFGPRFGIISFSPEEYNYPDRMFLQALETFIKNREQYHSIIRFLDVKTIDTAWKRMSLIMTELCNNIKEHANGIGYLSFSLNEKGSIFQIVVADVGRGLLKGLKATYNFKPESSADAIKMLFDLARHKSKRKKNRRGGRGFVTVKNIIKSFRGHITVRTGKASIRYEYNEKTDVFQIIVEESRLVKIEGTCIFISIPVGRETT